MGIKMDHAFDQNGDRWEADTYTPRAPAPSLCNATAVRQSLTIPRTHGRCMTNPCSSKAISVCIPTVPTP